MSKIEAGKYRLHREKAALASIVDQVGRMMRGRASEADLILQVEGPDPALIVDVDVRAIKQVLINLLANAITFTPAGGRVPGRRRQWELSNMSGSWVNHSPRSLHGRA